LSAELVDVLCRFGETAEAARLAAKIGLRRAADSVMPRPRVTRARAALAYAWTSLAQVQGRCAEAIKVARKWRNLIEAAGAVRDALRWGVRLAVLLRHAGDEIGARRELHRAIGVAAPAGLMQVLLEETEALGESLSGEFLAEIPAATPIRPAKAQPGGILAPRMPGGSLTPREVEILTLVGEGLSNAEIGHRLSLVEGSVKWHLQRIYDKIGTRRRLVAVDRARRMGVFR